MRCVLTLAKRAPSALLLAAQLAALLLYPFMIGNDVGRSLFSVFGIAILGLVVLAVRTTPGLTWVTVLLGIPATVLLLIQAVTQSDALLAYSSAFEAVLYFYAAGAMLAYMLEDQVVTRDELFAIGADVHAAGVGVRVRVHRLPGDRPRQLHRRRRRRARDRSWMDLLFLSFTTLSSTGLGDVVPVQPFARGLVMLEMVAGRRLPDDRRLAPRRADGHAPALSGAERRAPWHAATASSSQRSLSATPAWPLTFRQVIVCRATSASSSSHRSRFLTGCLAAVRQPRCSQPTYQRLTIASIT